ncbi:MAG: TolC family outer membrane protein [bacterium]|nr:TolC family outer membrane protein [bacterium]
MRTLIWSLTIFLCSSVMGKAEENKNQSKDTFREALAQAYHSNTELKANAQKQYVEAEIVPQAMAGFRPTVLTSASHTRQRDQRSPAPTSGESKVTNPSSLNLQIKQSLFKSWGTVAAVDGADQRLQASLFGFDSAEQKALSEAAQFYLQLLTTRETARLNRSTETRLRKALESVQLRAKVGEMSLTDVAQARSRLARASAERLDAESKVEIAEAAYVRGIGEQAPEHLSFPDPLTALMPETLEAAISHALEKSFDVRASSAQVSAAKHGICSAKSELLPTVSLTGSAERTLGRNTDKSRVTSLSAVVELTVPLYQGGAKWASLRAAEKVALQRKIELENLRRQLKEAAVQTWSGWTSAKERVGQFRIQVEAAEIRLEGTREEFAVGERIVLDVIDAEDELLRAQVAFVEARKAELLGAFRLLSVMGIFTVDNLNIDVKRYDVRGHAEAVRHQWFGT